MSSRSDRSPHPNQSAQPNPARRPRKLTPVEVVARLERRVEKRIEGLQRTHLPGFEVAISELETELDLLRRAITYLAGS
jgi:hypothetical protein